MSLEENKATVIKMYQAFDRQDIEQGQKYMAANIIGKGMDGTVRKGIESFIKYGEAIFEAFPDGCHQIEQAIAEGDKVVTCGVFKGTHKGELMGISPTGKQVQFSVVHIDRVVDGKVVEHWGQADLFAMMQQLQK